MTSTITNSMRLPALRAALLAASLLGSPSTPVAQGRPDPDGLATRLDAYLSPYADAGYLSGTLLVARGDSVLYLRSFGFANRELGVPFRADTRANVASITKPMTIILAGRLAEESRLSPGDTLSRWLPDFPSADRITISHLLNHRAGIPHRVTTSAEEILPHTATDMVAFASRRELLFEPGERSEYSSAGYSVLARVLELAGGRSYGELLAEYVLGPAGMTASAHADSRMLLPERASPYLYGRSGPVNAPLQDLSFLVGAGSVYSTATDLFRLQRALLAGRLGEAAQRALLRTSGFAWNGATGGFRAFADWHRETDVTVILTANLPSGANDRIRVDVPRLAAGETIPSPEVPHVIAADVPLESLRRYEGTYELRPGAPMPVRVGDGGLYVDQWFLIPTSDTTFFSPQDFGTVTAVFDDRGAVTRFDWGFSGGTIPMRRLPEPSARP